MTPDLLLIHLPASLGLLKSLGCACTLLTPSFRKKVWCATQLLQPTYRDQLQRALIFEDDMPVGFSLCEFWRELVLVVVNVLSPAVHDSRIGMSTGNLIFVSQGQHSL